MAARSPPPLVSAPHGPTDRPTTTISTIVVKSGEEAFLTVGLLQSGEFARLRIDEMRPPLLSIGKTEEENTRLLNIHQNLLKKLKMKEEECEALLARAAALPAEKEEEEAKVYTAMAVSLDCTWRELLRRLHLREQLLIDTSAFYRLLASHQEVSRVCISAISSLSQSQSPDGLARQIGVSVNEIVEITALAMESGSSVMGQLRILGELSDNYEREEEIYQAMLLIEGAMLKMASEWSHVEDSWVDEKKKRVEMAESGQGDQVDKELEEIGMWLAHAGKRLKASTEEGMKTILAEAEEQRTRLIAIISQTEDDRKLAHAGELARGVEELLALTRAALNKGARLRNFFVSATNMYHQLLGMERDMEKANESMAGELAPLARQKGTAMKEEADAILERERVTHDERRMVVNKRDEILEKINQIERLAQEKSDSGKMQARDNLRRGREWLVREAEPWMEKNGEMGGTTQTANQFVQRHSQFGETIVANDAAIQFAFNESSRLSEEEQRSSREFEERYTRLRNRLEQRLHLGKTFQQVNEFARELEASFDSLEQLIDQKAEHSERGLQQMSKVFEMIEETLGQERAQGERFISSATTEERTDSSLKTEEAKAAVREILVRHERRFTLMAENWNRWHQKKRAMMESMVEASRVMEEVQMWQEETVEIIRLWEEKRETAQREEVSRRMEEVKRRMGGERERIESLRSTVQDESTVQKVEQIVQRQREIEEKMKRVQSQMVEEERIVVKRQKALESARQEVNRVIEDVRMWQEETMVIVRLWEDKREEKKEEERREIQKSSEQIKIDLIQQNDRIEKIKSSIQDEETSKRVLDTVLRQREISDRVDGVKRRLIDEERIIEERKREAVRQEVNRVIEDVQMWQDDKMETIRLWETQKEEKKEEEKKEIQKKSEEIKIDLVQQNDRIEKIKPVIQDEQTSRRVVETIVRQREISDRVDEVKRKMQEEERIVEEKTKESMARAEEVARVIEEVQMWQDETMEIIRLWEDKKEEKKADERMEIQKSSEHIKMDLVQQNDRIERIKPIIQDEQTSRRVVETIVRQREISDRIDDMKRRMQEEERIVEEKKKEAVRQEVNHVIEEVQMWQDETMEIIRLWEEKKEERKVEERKEIQQRSEEIKIHLAQQNDRIEKIKPVIQDEQTSRRVVDTIVRQREISDRVDEVKRKMQEEERIVEEKRRESVGRSHEVARVIEEVQMWQDETMEVIRLWEDKREEKKEEERKEIQKRSEQIKIDLIQQNEKIEKIKSFVQDEATSRRVLETVLRQREISERIDGVKKRLSEERVVEDKKKMELQRARETVEEIEMWQEEIVTILRLWEDYRLERSLNEKEEIDKSIEAIRMDAKVQSERLQTTKTTFVKEQEWWNRISSIEEKQKTIGERLEKIQKGMREENEERKRIQREQETQLKKTLEEIEMWQDETVEIIRLWGEKKIEQKKVEIEEVKEKTEHVNMRIQQTLPMVRDEETAKRVERIAARQNAIVAQLKTVEQQLIKEEESLLVERVAEIIERPKITTQLVDVSIEEGKRVEIVAKIQSKPEATVLWLKDGREMEQSMDYRKTYVNGVATLSIEETFIEDSAVYTLKAINQAGETETTARLTVTSLRKDSEAPRVVRGLKSTSVEEGERLFLDCVVVAKPEPQVVWFKEESTIKEDERTRLDFKGDHCSLTLHPTTVADSGMYTAKAKNIHGEATSLCQVKVSPKKVPPPTPPKPERPDSRVGAPPRPPAMQCTLTNETYQEGMKAVLQVLVSGSPRPTIQWYINDTPVTTTERVKVTIEEDGWTRLIIDEIREEDAGLYMVVAENDIGEARTGATLHVQPKLTMTQVKRSFEEASGSEKTVIDVPPPTTQRAIEEKTTVEENGVETTQRVPAPSTTLLMETKTNGTEEFKQRDETRLELHPVQREEITTTTVTTNATSHIPVATSTRTKKEEFVQGEIGLSNTSTAPDLIRALQKEYTVNEEEQLFLEVLLVANPRPKVQWYFNDNIIPATSQFAEMRASGDSYSLRVKRAALENAGYYRIRVENVRGVTESLCIVHVRPAALGPAPKTKQHVTVQEEFAMFEYTQQRPESLYESRIPTLKTTHVPQQVNMGLMENKTTHVPQQVNMGLMENKNTSEYLEGYDFQEKQRVGNPPHFTQTLLSTVTADGSGAKFDGIVTGWPAPEMEWSRDGVIITRNSHPHITVSNIGGRVSLNFSQCSVADSGKYKCTASNEWGVATSSAQLVVRPKTVAPDFISRLISEEIGEGETLKWTVRVTGDPLPSVLWLRDGIIIPNCDEVKIIDEGAGVHSMLIHRIEMADSGQFTCLAENSAGEARSTADLVVRPEGAEPGNYFHVTKVTQEKQIKGQPVIGARNETFAIESPMV